MELGVAGGLERTPPSWKAPNTGSLLPRPTGGAGAARGAAELRPGCPATPGGGAEEGAGATARGSGATARGWEWLGVAGSGWEWLGGSYPKGGGLF